MNLNDQNKRLLMITLLLIGFIVIGYLILRKDISAYLAYVINEQTHPAIFILLYILLPILGFPIILFLILLGIKFGIETGTLIMFLCMPIHLESSFLMANNFLKPVIKNYVKKKGYRFPQIPENRILWFSFVFMVVPGLSYTMKNFVLALSGIPLRYYFFIGILVNGIMGIPFVIAGDAAMGKSFWLLIIIILVLLAAYGFSLLIKKRYYQYYFKQNS